MRLLALLAAGLFAGTLFAADDKKDKPKDEEAILGTWKMEKMETGGTDTPPAEVLAKMRLKFAKDGKMSITSPDGEELEFEYKMDPSAKMKTLDITREKQTALGVYELDGDSMKLCLGTEGKKTRPTEFKADGKGDGMGTVVMTLKRVKDEKKDEPKKDKSPRTPPAPTSAGGTHHERQPPTTAGWRSVASRCTLTPTHRSYPHGLAVPRRERHVPHPRHRECQAEVRPPRQAHS